MMLDLSSLYSILPALISLIAFVTSMVTVPIGKASFEETKLQENFDALMEAIVKARPSALKGQYLRNITLTSTMGPGVKVNVAKF